MYLTGNYTTAFNLGKQQETEQRFKHLRFERKLYGGNDKYALCGDN